MVWRSELQASCTGGDSGATGAQVCEIGVTQLLYNRRYAEGDGGSALGQLTARLVRHRER